MELVLFGVNHRTAPVALRERLAVDPADAPARLAALRADGLIAEAVLLSTCNRLEVYAAADLPALEPGTVRDIISARAGLGVVDGSMGYERASVDVAPHLMRVASGLDSLVVGERQILGQVKQAYAVAREASAVGPLVDRLFTSALRAAKRVQTETDVGAGAVSVASAAVTLAEKVLGRLAGRHAVVVGAGETASLAARHIAERRPARLSIVNRTLERAEALAAELGAEALPLAGLASALAGADLVVCATHAPEYLVTADMIRAARPARNAGSLVLVDVAVPRNIDPAAAEADNVFAYAIDALTAVVEHSLGRRAREAVRAEAIVEEEAARFGAWLRSLGAAPVVRELREHFERVRADEVRRSLKHFPESEQPHVEQLTRALVNKLLHAPTVRLKSVDPGSASGMAWIDALRELFALDESRHGADRGL